MNALVAAALGFTAGMLVGGIIAIAILWLDLRNQLATIRLCELDERKAVRDGR